MNSQIIIQIILPFLSCALLVLASSKKVFENDRLFIVKKLIDCIVPYVMYILLVIIHRFFLNTNGSDAFLGGIALGTVMMIIACIGFYIDQAKFFTKFDGKILGKSYIAILISMFSCLLIGCTMLNYLSYMIFPQFYDIPSSLNCAAVGFEFLYYTFSLMLTYGTNSIVAVHVVSKIIQIIEIALFYVLFGMMFVDLIAKVKQPAFDFESYFKSLPQQEDTKSNEGAPTKE